MFVHICHGQGEFGGKVGKPVQTFKTRHAIQPAPNAFGGAFFQQNRAVPVADNQPVKRQGRYFGGGFFARQLGGAVLLFRFADVRHRALVAQGFRPFAHGRAQIHQTLCIGRHIGVFRRQQAFGKCPERVFKFFVLRIAVAGEHAAEYAFDVAVQNGFAAVEGEGANGGGGASAYAAEGFQVFALRRKRAAELFDDLLRGFVQVARAAVIAQARPQRQHFVLRRGGKRLNGREFF
ncbi:Uncharacterised protein [Neisseria meningitidis]|nr:Uncharacterised protein [Neisseria meningitidis]